MSFIRKIENTKQTTNVYLLITVFNIDQVFDFIDKIYFIKHMKIKSLSSSDVFKVNLSKSKSLPKYVKKELKKYEYLSNIRLLCYYEDNEILFDINMSNFLISITLSNDNINYFDDLERILGLLVVNGGIQ